MRLMQVFTIDPKIKNTRARECIDFTSFSGIFMLMNQGGTTTMTDKDTSALIETLKETNEELLKQVALLTEQARLTVKMTRTCPRITEIITYKRRKQVGRKQDILASLPGEQVHYRLDSLTCPDCRHELKEIGLFCARQELLYVPAKVKRIDHIQHPYKCQHCSDKAPADKIIKAPAYRQEKDLRRMGLPLDHKTASNWHIKVCEYYLSSLYERLRQELLKLEVIHADETSYRVLDSETY